MLSQKFVFHKSKNFTSDIGKFVHLYMSMNFGAWAMQNSVKATVDSLRLPTFQIFEMRVPPTVPLNHYSGPTDQRDRPESYRDIPC